MIFLAAGITLASAAVFLFLFPVEKMPFSALRTGKGNPLGLALAALSALGAAFFTSPLLLVTGLAASHFYLKKREDLEKKRLAEKLEEDFEVFLGVVSSLYGATGDLVGSMEKAAASVPDPLSSEVRRAVREYRETGRLKTALEGLGERVPTRSVRFFVDAVLEAEKYGVEVEEVVGPLARMLRDRASLREELRSEVKGQRVTIQVLQVLLPVMLGVGLLVIPQARQVLSGSFFGQLIVAAVPLVEYGVWAASTQVESEVLGC